MSKCVRDRHRMRNGGMLKQGLSTYILICMYSVQCSAAPNTSYASGSIWSLFRKHFSSMVGIHRCGTWRCEEKIVT